LHGDRAVCDTTDPATNGVLPAARDVTEPFVTDQIWENWMKLVKTSAIALAMSALLVGPVLAQGAASDTQTRGGKTHMQRGTSGAVDEDTDAQAGATGQRAGANAKTGMKGTVGAGGGAPKGAGGAATPPVTSR
jgi:hypothetical protein